LDSARKFWVFAVDFIITRNFLDCIPLLVLYSKQIFRSSLKKCCLFSPTYQHVPSYKYIKKRCIGKISLTVRLLQFFLVALPFQEQSVSIQRAPCRRSLIRCSSTFVPQVFAARGRYYFLVSSSLQLSDITADHYIAVAFPAINKLPQNVIENVQPG